MGFFLKKSINLGICKLNLSKSGIGFSFGIKGFRISKNSRGTQLNMGRGGFYYRKQLGKNKKIKENTNCILEQENNIENSNEIVVIEISEELNRYIKKFKLFFVRPLLFGFLIFVFWGSSNPYLVLPFILLLIIYLLITGLILYIKNKKLHNNWIEILQYEADLTKKFIKHQRKIKEDKVKNE